MAVTEHRLLRLLRDSVWGFLWGLLGVAVAVAAFWWQRSDKSITYGVVSRGPLVSVRDDARGRLNVLFDGKPRQDLSQVVLRVYNSGNVPIAGEDFKRPLTFDFHFPVLGSEVVEMTPPDLHAAVRREGQQVTLEPLLLNQGDSVTLKVLLAGPGRSVDASARIVGIPRIHETDFSREPYHPSLWLVFGAGLILGPFVAIGLAIGVAVVGNAIEERKKRKVWARTGRAALVEADDAHLVKILRHLQRRKDPAPLPAGSANGGEALVDEAPDFPTEEMLEARMAYHLPTPGSVGATIYDVPSSQRQKIREWARTTCDPDDPAAVEKFREFLRTLP